MSTNTSKLRAVFPLILLILIVLGFFYKTIFFGKYPFPGDLLLTQYGPWRHQSYDGYVEGAIPTKNQYFDVLRELYPWKTVVVDQLKEGEIPFWNPYNFSGSPLLANYQSQVFYPFSIVYFFFPQLTAWSIMVIAQPVLGAIFMYLFATELGLTYAAAMLAALLFNFSGFASVWMEFTTVWHTILWLPLLLYIIERGVKNSGISFSQKILFIVATAAAITGGHPQDFINTFLFVCIYTAARIITNANMTLSQKKLFFVSQICTLFPIPFLLTMPQLLPTVELFKSSARVTHDYIQVIENMLVQWWQIPLLAVADFFGNPATGSSITGDYVGKTLSVGVVGFFLAASSLFNARKSWHQKFFIGTAITILLCTVRTPLSEILYRYPLPLLSTGTPTRILFLLAFAMALLAGYGYDYLKNQKIGRIISPLSVVWGIFGVFWILILVHPFANMTPEVVNVIKRSVLFASAFLFGTTILTLLSKKIHVSYLLIIPLCAIELAYGFLKFNPFVPRSFVYPENALIQFLKTQQGTNRVWGYGTAEMEANFATQVKLYSTDGTDPLNLQWYNQFIQSSKDGHIPDSFTRQTRSDAKLAVGFGQKDLPNNPYRLKVMDMLGVKYVIDRVDNPKDDTTFDTARFKPIWQKNAWTVFENMYAAPRTFVTGDVQFYTNSKDFEIKFFADSFKPGSSVLIESIHKNAFETVKQGSGSAQIIAYTPNTVTIGTITDKEQVLFLSDTYDPNWVATIDGKPTQIYNMTYAFRGVIVPPGRHTVVFSYHSKPFLTGIYISIATLFFGVSVAVVSVYISTKSCHGKKI